MLRAFLLLTLLSSSAAAETYRWVDENGVVQFSDRPPAGDQAAEVIEAREIPTIRTVSVERAGREHAARPRAAGSAVVLYSTERCLYCARARAYFAANDIAYVDYDVEKTRRGREGYIRLGGTGVPITVVGRQVIRGFDEQAFDRIFATTGIGR